MSTSLLSEHPQPWKVVWRSIEYPGQVIVAPRWKPSFGHELSGDDVHFRTVILTQPQAVPPGTLKDTRIAIWVPEAPLPPFSAAMSGILREGRAAYEIEEMSQWETGFSPGRILAGSTLPEDVIHRLSTLSLEEGLEVLARALLEGTYVDFPLDTSHWEHHLSSADIANVFEGLLRQRDDPPAVVAVERFAVGLGLAHPSDPFTLAPHNCPVFPLILEMVDKGGGQVSLPKLYTQLSQRFGLTWPLITLYLLSLVRHGNPPLEIQLRPRHRLVMRSGEKPPQGLLTAALISQVWWGRGLEGDFVHLRLSSEGGWNQVLPYARAVIAELKSAADATALKVQEEALLDALGELRAEAEHVRAELARFSEALGETADLAALRALGYLAELAQSDGYPAFYNACRRLYASPQALAEDIALCRQLAPLSQIGDEVARAKTYLAEAVLGEGDQELELDRLSLLEQLTLRNLVANPQLWGSLKALMQWFRSRYSVLYAAHHRRYWNEASSWDRIVADARRDLETLQRLNAIEELGEPLGLELTLDYQRLLAKTKVCPAAEDREPLKEWDVQCSHCGLPVTAELPRRELEDFLARLHHALLGQQRRLSSQAVRQILSHSTEGRLERFIKVIQTSDLSSLAQIMDDELLTFIRRLLAEAYEKVATEPLLRKLAGKFPEIREAEVDRVAAELASLLRDAFEEARAKRSEGHGSEGSS